MESLVSKDFWRGRRVFITGHTGFKGAWLAFWLSNLGAQISGLALRPANIPNLYDLLDISKRGNFSFTDINEHDALRAKILAADPEIIIHMAAQALVRTSYRDPVGTFMTNSMGTAALLDAARYAKNVKAILIVTTDKVYEPLDPPRPYREDDPLGGRDPYSASKAAAELIARSFRNSFYSEDQSSARIATVRAGNVIGGGDWSQDRIIPDLVRDCLIDKGVAKIRNPHAIRPWQHVFDVLNAYLMISERLYNHTPAIDTAWNIGPSHDRLITVDDLARQMIRIWGRGTIAHETKSDQPHEEPYLALASDRAHKTLHWAPRLGLDETVKMTAEWYQAWIEGREMIAFSEQQLEIFKGAARE